MVVRRRQIRIERQMLDGSWAQPRPLTGSLATYLGAHERVLHVSRQHPCALARNAWRAGGLLVPLMLVTWGVSGLSTLQGGPATQIVRVLLLVMFVLVLRLAWSVLSWEFERFVVTDDRLIHVRGVLARRIASTPLTKVRELVVRQPALGRLFGYGSLVVDGPGGGALHGLEFVPDPAALYRLVSDQARRGRASEGGGSVPERQPHADETEAHAAVEPAAHPWQPTAPDVIDHTIEIPRVQLPER